MKKSYVGLTALAALAALTIACASPEANVIESFFRATQAKDSQTVSSFSIVPFEQEVKSWKVKSVSEQQRTPAPLGSLAKALKAADDAVATNKKDAGAYFNAHPLEVDKVKPLVEAGKPVPANLQKTADDWKKFNDADRDLREKAAAAKGAYDREKRLVGMSTGQTGTADTLAGDLVISTASVEVNAGGEVKTYTIQLRKYDVAPGGQGNKVMSRWLIQSITPQ
jgi:hypothetical protein